MLLSVGILLIALIRLRRDSICTLFSWEICPENSIRSNNVDPILIDPNLSSNSKFPILIGVVKNFISGSRGLVISCIFLTRGSANLLKNVPRSILKSSKET